MKVGSVSRSTGNDSTPIPLLKKIKKGKKGKKIDVPKTKGSKKSDGRKRRKLKSLVSESGDPSAKMVDLRNEVLKTGKRPKSEKVVIESDNVLTSDEVLTSEGGNDTIRDLVKKPKRKNSYLSIEAGTSEAMNEVVMQSETTSGRSKKLKRKSLKGKKDKKISEPGMGTNTENDGKFSKESSSTLSKKVKKALGKLKRKNIEAGKPFLREEDPNENVDVDMKKKKALSKLSPNEKERDAESCEMSRLDSGPQEIIFPIGTEMDIKADEPTTTNPSQHTANSGNLENTNAIHETRKRRQSGDSEPALPFKRVRESDIVFKHDELRDNSFYSKNDTFGQKAHKDLVVTRGKGFRKEMTKKKRLSHHGGKLNYQVNSFKFPDDDSE